MRVLSFLLVEEYDPSTPSKAVVRCVVKNDSGIPIHVAVGFDGGYIRVEAGQVRLSRAERFPDDVKLTWVEPRHEQVVFELPLDELLSGKQGKDAAWRWDWERHPEPPRSPIHAYRKPGFVEGAPFVVSLTLGDSTLISEPAILNVKPGRSK
jgi:hypothetical protein